MRDESLGYSLSSETVLLPVGIGLVVSMKIPMSKRFCNGGGRKALGFIQAGLLLLNWLFGERLIKD